MRSTRSEHPQESTDTQAAHRSAREMDGLWRFEAIDRRLGSPNRGSVDRRKWPLLRLNALEEAADDVRHTVDPMPRPSLPAEMCDQGLDICQPHPLERFAGRVLKDSGSLAPRGGDGCLPLASLFCHVPNRTHRVLPDAAAKHEPALATGRLNAPASEGLRLSFGLLSSLRHGVSTETKRPRPCGFVNGPALV
jgi:hypothetical protein